MAPNHCLSITTAVASESTRRVSCLLAGPELRRVIENDSWTQARGTSLADLEECLGELFREELRIRSALDWRLKPHTMLGERFRISPLIKNKSIKPPGGTISPLIKSKKTCRNAI